MATSAGRASRRRPARHAQLGSQPGARVGASGWDPDLFYVAGVV